MTDFPDYLLEYFDYKLVFFERYDSGFGYHFADPLVKELVPWYISINPSHSFEEQIKTLIHEVLHYHPLFNSRFRKNSEDKEIEIEKYTLEIYDSRKDIVNLATRALNEAWDLTRVFGQGF